MSRSEFKSLTGRGVQAVVEGNIYAVGEPALTVQQPALLRLRRCHAPLAATDRESAQDNMAADQDDLHEYKRQDGVDAPLRPR